MSKEAGEYREMANDAMIELREKLDKAREALRKIYDKDWDFDLEHYEWGNYDDSYDYGFNCGKQVLASTLLGIIGEEDET